MRIIFFHHAGGDQYAFMPYKALIDDMGWEYVVYEFPGHGDRFNENLVDDALRLAHDAHETLREMLTGDYLFFGNSMGSLLAYLVLHQVHSNKGTLPLHFFAASRKCPASYPAIVRQTPLSREEFWNLIVDYGGPESITKNKELQELYEPILRADYNILESYSHILRPRLPVPATILFGKNDRYSREDLNSWSEHFNDQPVFREFDGGHFFAYEQPEEVIRLIRTRIGQ